MANIFDLFKKIENGNGQTPQTANVEWIIVGLGNVGREYDGTRHNTGFMAIDVLALSLGVHVDRLKFLSCVGRCEIGGHGVLLMQPRTYMNRSGEAVRDAAEFYKIQPDHILVVSDDINLDAGRIRIRRSGSDGGHNGLKNIIYHLNSDNFPRIRIGAGKKPPEYDMADWVLSKFSDKELALLKQSVTVAADNVGLILDGKFDEAQQICNSFKADETQA